MLSDGAKALGKWRDGRGFGLAPSPALSCGAMAVTGLRPWEWSGMITRVGLLRYGDPPVALPIDNACQAWYNARWTIVS